MIHDANWIAGLDDLRAAADRVGKNLLNEGGARHQAEATAKLFGNMVGAYFTNLVAAPDRPAFLPSVGFYQRFGTPDPDTVYRTTTIDGDGEYLITGQRGTASDVNLMPMGRPTAGGMQTFPSFDLDELTIDQNGRFEVVLSGHRPDGVRDWWPLDPDMRTLMLRSVSSEWGIHTDPRIAIVRTDIDPDSKHVRPDDLRVRLATYAKVVEGMMLQGIRRVGQLRAEDIVNRVVSVDYQTAGGGLRDQWYHEGCFDLDQDESLLIETLVPEGVRRFSLSLTDSCFSTLDWANTQSSLNKTQAAIDQDGLLRVVVAPNDPGLHNWLDTAGREFGVIQLRWQGGEVEPEISLKKLLLSAPNDLLAPSPRVTEQQRREMIRKRQIGAQLRSLW